MKIKHNPDCIRVHPECLCNICKKDKMSCCSKKYVGKDCIVKECKRYEVIYGN